MREFMAERITRQWQHAFSERADVRLERYDPTDRLETVIRAVTTEFGRMVWTGDEGECYLTLWDHLRAVMPRWTQRFVGCPVPQWRVFKMYHTCPHFMVDPKAAHLAWLSQDER